MRLQTNHAPDLGNVVQFPEVGGLHHHYERLAAWWCVIWVFGKWWARQDSNLGPRDMSPPSPLLLPLKEEDS